MHYAGDRAGGIHFQFVSLLNVSRPATDKDSLTTASIYDSSKSYNRIEKFLKNQIEEFDNLEDTILTRVRYPPLNIDQINDNQKHLQVLKQIKQHKVPRIDLIPKFHYPKHIANLKAYQGIMIKDLEIEIGRKFVWGVDPKFTKQTELAFHEVNDISNLEQELFVIPCSLCYRMFSDQLRISQKLVYLNVGLHVKLYFAGSS